MTPIETGFRSGVKRHPVSDALNNSRMAFMGDRVRELRLAARGKNGEPLQRDELAAAVGMSKTTLQTIEDKSQRSSRHVAELAAYFGVDPYWLQTGKGPKVTHTPADAEQPAERFHNVNGKSGERSHNLGIDPAILHEAVTLLLFDLDHGGPRPARSASTLLLDLITRIHAGGGRLSDDEERAFLAEARSRGERTGATADAKQRKTTRNRRAS